MAFLSQDEVYDAYTEAKDEANIWRKDYSEFERLADNGLIADLDENLPEVNDGSLAASLFKLPKRIVNSKLKGRATALDSDDAWITELANIRWEKSIIPNANSQAPFHRKWKDCVRKAAIYGGQPIITLFVERGDYTGSDFIVPYAQDVILEAGKVSDYDSDIIFWDVYYTQLQVKNMIEQAKKENAEAKESGADGYNKWDVPALEEILKAKLEEDRSANNEHHGRTDKNVKKSGIHFYVAFQRGVQAPFYMCHGGKKKTVREWSNPDPTGDLPVHYLYCYQDFINPYGIGIVKLAGGTQNVLDYMRQADVKATQLGIEPPIDIHGNADSADLESLVYAQRAQWFTGDAIVKPVEISGDVYNQLPNRIQMYQSSLNKLIPTGDTSVSAEAGDPTQSKTPAGVKLAAASLSIDDEDFKDNLYMTYEATAKSMINTEFANMQGKDLMKLNDEDRDNLMQSGLEFPVDEMGNPTNELEVIWDESRATFNYEVDAENDKAKDDEHKLEGLKIAAEFLTNPNSQMLFTGQPIYVGTKKVDPGEIASELLSLATDNDKVITDASPEELAGQAEQAAMAQQAAVDPATGQPVTGMEEVLPEQPIEGDVLPAEGQLPQDPETEQGIEEIQTIMERYNVDESTAAAMLAGIDSGFTADEVLQAAERHLATQGAPNV